MRLFRAYGVGLAVPVVLLGAIAAVAGTTMPNPLTVIHDHKHLANVKQGKVLTYHFKRSASQPKVLGESFTDDITITVTAERPAGEKDVDMQIYSGDRARELQRMQARTANPIFLVYFNQALSTYGRLAGGKSAYLWRAFSAALEKNATVVPVKFDYEGKPVNGYRIVVVPYAKDDKVAKMEGWEDAKFEIVVSDAVPGEVARMVSFYENKHDKSLKLEERYTLGGVEGLE